MITRRAFLTGLTATTALVAVPGAAVATVNHDAIMALLESKMAEAQRNIIADAARLFYDDTAKQDRKFGLASLLDDADLESVKNAPLYDWVEVTHGFSVDVTAT